MVFSLKFTTSKWCCN